MSLQLQICIQYYNVILKYADDEYLIIPANNQNTCKAEIQDIEQWANTNNLKLNRSKSKEIVFTKQRSCQQTDLPLPPPIVIVEGESNISWSWASLSHTTIQWILPTSTTLLLVVHMFCMDCTVHTLRRHGMPLPALHSVFQSTAMVKVTYAAPAWWGFT